MIAPWGDMGGKGWPITALSSSAQSLTEEWVCHWPSWAQSSQNLSSSTNEEDFFPWEIAKLEDCEPEASGGHLAFVEKKR